MAFNKVSIFTLADSLILTVLLVLSVYLLTASPSPAFSEWLVATVVIISSLLLLIALQVTSDRIKQLYGLLGGAHIVLCVVALGDAAAGLWLVFRSDKVVEGFHFAAVTLSTLIVLVQAVRMATLFGAFVLLRSHTDRRYETVSSPEIQEDALEAPSPTPIDSFSVQSPKSASFLATSGRVSEAETLFRQNSSF